jgi:tetratricopeptide (TPR) repeat protein
MAVHADAAGDPQAAVAAAAAAAVARAVRRRGPHAAVVVAPRFGLPWADEDLVFLELILAESADLDVVVASAPDAIGLPEPACGSVALRIPADAPASVVALVPGIVEPSVRSTLAGLLAGSDAGLLPLARQFTLVPPECRRPPADVPRHEYDWLAVLAGGVPWLAAYAQCFASDELVDPRLLHAESARRWSEGSASAAIRLAGRAAECARSAAERELLQCWSAGLRIALRRFGELAEWPDPPATAGSATRGFLHQAKGWGLVMSGRAAEADAHLEQARALYGAGAGSREHLYLLNISALARLRLGDAAGALALEEAIAGDAAALDPPDPALEYLNAINLARLRRRLGDLEGARRDYSRAFDVTLGTRSDSELVYTNVTLGRLAAGSGDPDEALLCALRAALHWLAGAVPEAIGSRTLAAVVGRPWPPRARPEVAEVAAALTAQLNDAALACGLAAVATSDPAPAFVRSDAADREGLELRAAGADGVGFLTAMPALPGRRICPEQARLGALVRDLLDTLCPGSDVATAGTIVVDARFGREVPVTAAELLGVCIRLGVGQMVVSGLAVTLDEATRSALERSASVRLGPAVSSIERNGTVRFKRILPPRPLDGDEAQVIGSLDRLDIGRTLRVVRALEAGRVVTVDLAPA